MEGVPLELTLDGRSLAKTAGPARREVEYLVSLARTPVLDVLVLDAPDGFADHLERGYAAEPDLDRDHRLIRQAGSSNGFYGGVTPWSSRERRADEMGLAGTEREWFLYYEATTWFHRNSRRHFFVTTDAKLLRELADGDRRGWWSDRRIMTPRAALKMLGWVMRRRDRIYLEARPGYTAHTTNFDFYMDVGFWLVPNRLRLTHWLRLSSDEGLESELGDLEQSIHARVVDLLKARDGVAFAWLRHQNNATLDDMLYHLRNAVPTTTALFDSLATFARIAFQIDVANLGGSGRVSLGVRDFRRALRNSGASCLADRAASAGLLWQMLSALRNPIIHGSGLSGVGYQKVPGPPENRLTLRNDQADKVTAAARSVGEDAASWGLHDTGYEPLLEPLQFVERFSAAVLRAADELIEALADDLEAPEVDYAGHGDEIDRLWKFGLIGGLTSELSAAGAPVTAS